MGLRTWIATGLVTVLAAGYVALDAVDVVPGFLTVRPVVVEPAARPHLTAAEAAPVDAQFAHAPTASADIQAAFAEFAASPEIGPRPSIQILDASTGESIASHNPTQLGPPASSTKVLTAVAALSALGPSTTFDTTAMLSGDSLVLVGGGDLLLGTSGERPVPGDVFADAAPSSDDADGYASLTRLAEQVAASLTERGVTTVSLGVDDTLFDGPGSPVWAQGDYEWVIRMTPLALHGALDGGDYLSSPDYSILTAQTFAAELAAYGITVNGEPSRVTVPDGAEQVGVVTSAPVEEVVRYMLKTSNNSVAEALGRLVAISRGEGNTAQAAASAVSAELAEVGLPTTGLLLQDTCGLASQNLISADLLARTVAFAYDASNPRLTSLIASLPVAYLDGTLADRIPGAAGEVRAKTGTLNTVVSLTGIVEGRSGSTLVFSIVGTDLANTWEARARIDAFMTQLAEIA